MGQFPFKKIRKLFNSVKANHLTKNSERKIIWSGNSQYMYRRNFFNVGFSSRSCPLFRTNQIYEKFILYFFPKWKGPIVFRWRKTGGIRETLSEQGQAPTTPDPGFEPESHWWRQPLPHSCSDRLSQNEFFKTHFGRLILGNSFFSVYQNFLRRIQRN